METLRDLGGKINLAIEKIKKLKDEKESLELKVIELEEQLNEKNKTIEGLQSEKAFAKEQLECLLSELEKIEL